LLSRPAPIAGPRDSVEQAKYLKRSHRLQACISR